MLFACFKAWAVVPRAAIHESEHAVVACVKLRLVQSYGGKEDRWEGTSAIGTIDNNHKKLNCIHRNIFIEDTKKAMTI